MRNTLLLALLPVVAMLASGCASMPEQSSQHTWDSSHSKAWNLTRAAGIKLRDADREDVKQDVPGGEPSLLASGVFGGASYMTPPPGLSPGAAGLMGGLAFFLSDDTSPAEYPKIVAWVPQSQATTAEAASTLLNETVRLAYQTVLTRETLPEPYMIKGFDHFPSDGTYGAIIEGGECAGRAVTMTEDVLNCSLRYNWITPHDIGSNPGMVSEGNAPELLGSTPSWRIIMFIKPSIIDQREFPDKWYARLPEVELYAKISRHLPEWSFIYLAPGKISYRSADGSFKLLKFPVVAYQGDILYFVRPASKSSD